MKKLMIFAFVLIIQPLADACAATSASNSNVRILEDTLWLVAFILIASLGLLMRSFSAGNRR